MVKFSSSTSTVWLLVALYENIHSNILRGGGGGGSGLSFWKKDFELGVGGEGQDTSRHFDGSVGSIRAILFM